MQQTAGIFDSDERNTFERCRRADVVIHIGGTAIVVSVQFALGQGTSLSHFPCHRYQSAIIIDAIQLRPATLHIRREHLNDSVIKGTMRRSTDLTDAPQVFQKEIQRLLSTTDAAIA